MQFPHPRTRTPHEGVAPRSSLLQGVYVFDPDQDIDEVAEVTAYLDAGLWLMDPDGGNDQREHRNNRRGGRN